MIMLYVILGELVLAAIGYWIFYGQAETQEINLSGTQYRPGDLIGSKNQWEVLEMRRCSMDHNARIYKVTPTRLADRYSWRNKFALILIPVLQFLLLTLLF